jgi:hypothetical protein
MTSYDRLATEMLRAATLFDIDTPILDKSKVARRREAKRRRRWKEQKGRCWYCKERMEYGPGPAKMEPGVVLYKLATFEHLDDKFSCDRGNRAGELRVVLSCMRCNWRRSEQRVAEHISRVRAGEIRFGERT